jgi:hypothetical protein
MNQLTDFRLHSRSASTSRCASDNIASDSFATLSMAFPTATTHPGTVSHGTRRNRMVSRFAAAPLSRCCLVLHN